MSISQRSLMMVLAVLAFPALAGAPDYDAFCDRNGKITTEQHGFGLIAMLNRPEQVEGIYADAANGDARAQRVVDELETSYFPDTGRELAELVSRPPCLLPAFRELSGWCVPNWSFLNFLDKDKPGGGRLRKALSDGFAERAHERQLENQVILSALNALIGVSVAATVIREGEIAASARRLTASYATSEARTLSFTERSLQKGFTKHGADFGLEGNWNPTRANDFRAAVTRHLNGPGIRRISGTYRGEPVIHYVNPTTGLNVMADQIGNYVSGWRLSADQMKSVLETGRLF
jgi:hypothetical protein